MKYVSDTNPKLFDLLKSILCLEPSNRITVEQALKHDYFN